MSDSLRLSSPMTDRARTLNGVPVAEAWDLVGRITRSGPFQKSPRIRELFQYLCECALHDPPLPVTEHQIGVAVFGRPPRYDSNADTIVRVQVSQLRRRLEHYFLTEGQQETLIVEIPRGSYVPIFRPRTEEATEDLPAVGNADLEASSNYARQQRRLRWWAVVLLVLTFMAVSAWLVRQQPGELPIVKSATPYLDRFWAPFANGRPTQIVVSDANLIILSDMLRQLIHLGDYRATTFPAQYLDWHLKDKSLRPLADNIVRTHMTGMQDTAAVRAITLLSARYQFPVSVISARDFRMPQPDNLILVGHKKGNPWVEFFEDRMNFRYDFDFSTGVGHVLNSNPLPGEQKEYPASYGSRGYCVVAVFPKPAEEGLVLVLFGSDMSSLDAGAAFISDNRALGNFYARLDAMAGKSAPPNFEVLLRAKLLNNLASGFEILALRAPKEGR